MPTVVTVTQPGVTVTATPTGSGASSTLSAGAVAGIVIGCLLGGILFIALVFYLLDRYSRHNFTRVANPARDHVAILESAPDLHHLPSTSSRRSNFFTRYSQRPSISNEPLMTPVSLSPLPSTPPTQSSATPRLDPFTPGIGDSYYHPYDFGEISQLVDSGTVSHSAAPAIPSIPPVRKPERSSLQSGLGDSPPHTRRTSGDEASSPSPSPKPQSTLFIHRMLQSRARASEGVSLSHRPSLDFSPSRSTTQDSSVLRVDEERLLAEAERTALRDAENIRKDEEDDWGEADSASVYSQISAPIDYSDFSDPASRQNSSPSLPRRKSSRRNRPSAPSTELPPVAEVPDTPRVLEGQSGFGRVWAAGNSLVDRQALHGTASRSISSVIDQPSALPLLTSTNFGKGSTASSTPPGSISSTAGWGSRSSGNASRYPSLAPSSIGRSSQSGPRSDNGTDWRHPPSGLTGIASLQIGHLQNPHSPVEEPSEQPDVSRAPRPVAPVPAKRAHLREGTASSIPEVERRAVMQGGIAHIDVAL